MSTLLDLNDPILSAKIRDTQEQIFQHTINVTREKLGNNDMTLEQHSGFMLAALVGTLLDFASVLAVQGVDVYGEAMNPLVHLSIERTVTSEKTEGHC